MARTNLSDGLFGDWNDFGHAGEGETSITNAVVPELCDLSKAKRQMPDYYIRLSETVLMMYDISELSETVAIGDPTLATEEKGKILLDALINTVVESIEELEKTDWKYDRLKS